MGGTLRGLFLLEALATLALGAQAQTRMYKCAVEGRTIYQQTACGIDTSPAAARAASAAASGATPGATAPTARAASTSGRAK